MTGMMKVIMTLSVLVNVLLLGTVGSYTYRASQHSSIEHKVLHDKLSPEGQKHMARTFEKVRSEIKDNFHDARKLKHDMVVLMQADEFDAKAYDRLAEQMMAMHLTMMRAKMETHKQLAQELPVEDRKALAKRLSNLGGPKGGRSRQPSGQNRQERHQVPTDHVSP